MNKKNFRVLFLGGIVLLLTAFVFSSFAGAASKDSSIGFVDMERLQNELPDFVRFQEVYKDKQQEFNYYRGYIYQQQQTAEKELEKQAAADKAGKKAEDQAAIDKTLQDDVKKKNDEFNGQIQTKFAEIQKYLNEQKEATLTKVKAIIQTVAEDKKLTMVVEKNTLLYGGTDITQLVIEKAKKLEVAPQKDAPKKEDTKTK